MKSKRPSHRACCRAHDVLHALYTQPLSTPLEKRIRAEEYAMQIRRWAKTQIQNDRLKQGIGAARQAIGSADSQTQRKLRREHVAPRCKFGCGCWCRCRETWCRRPWEFVWTYWSACMLPTHASQHCIGIAAVGTAVDVHDLGVDLAEAPRAHRKHLAESAD